MKSIWNKVVTSPQVDCLGLFLINAVGWLFIAAPDRPQEEVTDRGGGSNPDTHDRFRGHDIKLLKSLTIKYICDLMVEKKKVKFGMK